MPSINGKNGSVECRQLGISGSTLKIIAMIAMIIDHTAMIFVPDETTAYFVMRYLIGRMAFPIFCFLLVEGFQKTRSRAGYARRLFWFAVLSEVPFDLASQYNYANYVFIEHQNVFFTLLLGLLMLWGIEWAGQYMESILQRFFSGQHSMKFWRSNFGGEPLQYLMGAAMFTAAAWLAEKVILGDYGIYGIFAILMLYLLRKCPEKWQQLLGCGVAFIWEPGALLALFPISFYNGQRGWKIRLPFYAVYPVHLLLLYLLRQLLFP